MRPTLGKRCSSMLNVTLPRKPVPPIKKIFRPLKISVGESPAVMIQICLPLLLGEGRGGDLACYAYPTHSLSIHLITSALTKQKQKVLSVALPKTQVDERGTEPVALAAGSFHRDYPLASASGSVPIVTSTHNFYSLGKASFRR